MRSSACARTSVPFCGTRRATRPKSGTSSRTGRPASFCSSALQTALPRRSPASKRAGRCGSVAGFHSSGSIPFTIPKRSPARPRRTPSRPYPWAGRLDLAGVGRADGRDQRGVGQRGLGEVQGAEVLELVRVVVLRPEAGDEQGAAVGDPLVREVVDRVEAGRAVEGLRPLHGVDVHGDERRLPVVRVHDVGMPAERLAELERAAREEREALEVVGVRLRGGAVQVLPVVVVMVLEEVDGHVAPGEPAQAHAAVGGAPADRHGERRRRGRPARPRGCRGRAASRRARRCRGGGGPSAARPPRRRGRRSWRRARTRRRRTGP